VGGLLENLRLFVATHMCGACFAASGFWFRNSGISLQDYGEKRACS
jgi:hypothetical protein